ncbi:hypothetical protein RJ640_002392 [Escallonia rubra]|uniref:CCHC-type domain-containing protein n=1 Tax=Escallonia rubra TaxID=112253 RepID=A0AA88UKL2_9ASTE|nr:hypothetical protein RJ640_002392 [Escallonia rubra]
MSQSPQSQKQRNNGDWSSRENPDACYECGRTGHIKKYCPQLKNKSASSSSRDTKEKKFKPKKALLTWDDSDESDKEMSEDDDIAQLCFMAKDDHSDEDGGLVTFRDNSNRKIIGKGKICNGSISIDNVSLVDGLKFNLISISQLIDSGHKVYFEGDHCLIRYASDGGTLVGKRNGNIYTLSFDGLDSSREVCLYVQ